MLGPELFPVLLPFPCPFELLLLLISMLLPVGRGAVALPCGCVVRNRAGLLSKVSNA